MAAPTCLLRQLVAAGPAKIEHRLSQHQDMNLGHRHPPLKILGLPLHNKQMLDAKCKLDSPLGMLLYVYITCKCSTRYNIGICV